MHQIEYKAAKLEAQKLQMANESRRVYDEYLEALESTKVQVKTLNSDGSASYKDIFSYEDFVKAGYALEFKGIVYDNSDTYTYTAGNNVYYSDEPFFRGQYVGGGSVQYTDKYGNKFQSSDNDGNDGNGTYFFNATGSISNNFNTLAAAAYGANYATEPTGQELEKIITKESMMHISCGRIFRT